MTAVNQRIADAVYHTQCSSCGVLFAEVQPCSAPVDGDMCGRLCCYGCSARLDDAVYFCPGHARPMSGTLKRPTAPKREPLEVWTARVTYAGADRLDITRRSCAPIGVAFAPSWEILRPVLAARTTSSEAKALVWELYARAYRLEMRRSYVERRDDWKAVLDRSSVTFVCFCGQSARCHRSLLASYFGRLGANVRGER